MYGIIALGQVRFEVAWQMLFFFLSRLVFRSTAHKGVCVPVEKLCCGAEPWRCLAEELRALLCLTARLSMGISFLALPIENCLKKHFERVVINEALSKRKDVSNELLQGSIFCLALFKNSINLFDDGNKEQNY